MMNEEDFLENFLPLTLREYQSLIRLKKAGVRELEVFFYGSDGGGIYDRLWFVPYSKTIAEEFEDDFRRIEKYLYRNLNDKQDDLLFDCDGSFGCIDIDLTKDEFSISLEAHVPIWLEDFLCFSAILSPATELEALVAEVLND